MSTLTGIRFSKTIDNAIHKSVTKGMISIDFLLLCGLSVTCPKFDLPGEEGVS